MTSELVDKVSLKFSPTYSKIQFELENAIKRQQRLEGDDHFLNAGNKPQTKAGDAPVLDKEEKLVRTHILNIVVQGQMSTLRIDDIDVYLRLMTYEQRIFKNAERLIQRLKLVPMRHRFEIFTSAQDYLRTLKAESLDRQRHQVA